MNNGAFLNKQLQNDDVFVNSQIVNLSSLTGIPSRKGLENAIVCEDRIVHVVSNEYGHLQNQLFFGEVERSFIEADINYKTRSINRDNRSFAVDYILDDERFEIDIKNGIDKIKPMLRFTNSYDGSCKTSGHFGFYREVCSNGLHVAQSQIGFSVKHTGLIDAIVLPRINGLIDVFMNNEYYQLSRKFEALSESKIYDVNAVIKEVADRTKLFKFEKSDLNPEPSLNARLVAEVIERESQLLNEVPNKWLVYNAFNELTHDKLKKTFDQQKRIDSQLFELITAM